MAREIGDIALSREQSSYQSALEAPTFLKKLKEGVGKGLEWVSRPWYKVGLAGIGVVGFGYLFHVYSLYPLGETLTTIGLGLGAARWAGGRLTPAQS